MKNDFTKELNERIATHKYSIIASSLIMFENEGIYNSYLLQQKYGDKKMSERGKERAFKVADDLEDNADQQTYDQIYEMCWQRAKHKIQDKLYGIDN